MFPGMSSARWASELVPCVRVRRRVPLSGMRLSHLGGAMFWRDGAAVRPKGVGSAQWR